MQSLAGARRGDDTGDAAALALVWRGGEEEGVADGQNHLVGKKREEIHVSQQAERVSSSCPPAVGDGDLYIQKNLVVGRSGRIG